MVVYCAKQGVEQKISFEDFLSAMISDYECAYACGLAARLLKLDVAQQTELSALKSLVEEALPKQMEELDFRIRNLFRLIGDYTLSGQENEMEEIKELIRMGFMEAGYDQYMG